MATRWWLCVCSLGLLFLTPCALSEKFSLSGSPRPVVGIIGQDVVLPCQLSPTARLPRMDLWWRKIGTGFTPVHEYSDVGPSEQPGEGYQNRTELFLQEFSNGNISLKLKQLQVADAGTYHCFVRNPEWSQEATTELQVAAVTPLFIDVLGPQNQGIGLACRSAGWFPKPELQWVGKNQLNRTMESVTNMTQDGENLYSFVSRVTVTEDNGDISCIVRNGLLKTEQQLAIHLSSDAFPRMSSWLVAFWALFAAVLIAAGACACFGLTGKRKASKKKLAEKEALLTLEDKKTTLESGCKELRESLHAARKDFDTGRQELRESLDAVWKYFETGMQKLLKSLDTQKKAFEAECQNMRHEMETVKNENISLKSVWQELGKNLDTQKKAFEAECQKLRREMETAKNENISLKSVCQELGKNLDTQKKAFEAECQKLHHDLGNKRKIFEAECSKLQENLETEKKEKEDLKSELEQLRQKLENEKKEKESLVVSSLRITGRNQFQSGSPSAASAETKKKEEALAISSFPATGGRPYQSRMPSASPRDSRLSPQSPTFPFSQDSQNLKQAIGSEQTETNSQSANLHLQKEQEIAQLEKKPRQSASVTLDLENNHSGLTASDYGRTAWHNPSSTSPAPHLPQEKEPQGLHVSLPPETSKWEKPAQSTWERKYPKAAATNLSREGDSNRAGAATPGNTPQPAGGKEPSTPRRPKPIPPPKPKGAMQRNARFPNSTP